MLVNFVLSALRTVVSLAAAGVVSVAGYFGLPVSGEVAASVASLALAGAWFVWWRGLELAGTRLGWAWLQKLAGLLLGWPRQPKYQQPDGRPNLVEMGRALRRDQP
ncbi:MAG TPA: hypothetical protein VFY14_04010 [Streptomyces sp.]|nr:hypothetical protein [Streptomyces sp.]